MHHLAHYNVARVREKKKQMFIFDQNKNLQNLRLRTCHCSAWVSVVLPTIQTAFHKQLCCSSKNYSCNLMMSSVLLLFHEITIQKYYFNFNVSRFQEILKKILDIQKNFCVSKF